MIWRNLAARGLPAVRGVLLSSVLVGAAGCSWVKLSEGGAQVRQAQASEVAGCTKVGVVSANTRDNLVFKVKRKSAKVAEEIVVLARNQAAQLGANAIVPLGPVEDGASSFDAYQCKQGGS